MDHKIKQQYREPDVKMEERTQISYLIQEDFREETASANNRWDIQGTAVCVDVPNEENRSMKICGENSSIRTVFPAQEGKLAVSLWVRMEIHNTGVNVLTLYAGRECGDADKVIQMDTEGAYFYAYDGKKKQKLCHFESDAWYSVYLVLDTKSHTYSLFVDGKRLLWNAAFIAPADTIHVLSSGSYGGVLYVNRVQLYARPVQSVEQAVPDGGVLLDAREMGIAADGTTVVTDELQRLIDQAGQSGGVVYLKDGTYLTGMIELKRNVTLYIEEDAVLKGVLDFDAYPVRLSSQHPNWNTMVQGPQKSLIYADSQENIRIMGGGTIDGSGDFPGAYGSESLRVCAVLLVGCPQAQLCDLYVKDAGMWTIPVVECDDLYIHDLNLYSTWYPNRDGIDICDCFRVLIENCCIQADDDAICFKSGNESGCDNVLVRNTSIVSTMANGIKFGTYSYGGFTNCVCEDCMIKDTRTCAIAVQCVDGGRVRNLRFRRITIQNVESVFFIIIADKGRTPDWGTRRIGSVEEITFEWIEAERVRRPYGCYLGGYRTPGGEVHTIRDIYFHGVNAIYEGGVSAVPSPPPEFADQYPESNVFGNLPASAYYIRHADTVVFEKCGMTVALPDARPAIQTEDAVNVSIDGRAVSSSISR